MDELSIVIVSHKRPNRVITSRILPDAMICVPESQEASYRDGNPGHEILVHPDSIRGLPAKRQWIYETLGDVFMIDDDISGVVDMSDPRSRKVRGDTLVSIIQQLHDASKQLGVYLWGFSYAQNVLAYQVHRPFRLSGRIPGLCMGINAGSKLWFNGAGITTADDDWIVALNAHFHRISLVDTRYGFVEDRRDRSGGAGEIRTATTIKGDIDAMERTFGHEVIERVTDDSGVSGAMGYKLRIPWKA